MTSTPDRSVVYLWTNASLLLGGRMEQHVHAHPLLEIAVDLDEKFDAQTHDPEVRLGGMDACMVGPNTTHVMHFRGARHATLWIASPSSVARAVGGRLGGEPMKRLESTWVRQMRAECVELYDRPDPKRARETVPQLLASLARDAVPGGDPDPRVSRAREEVDAIDFRRLSVPELAERVGLSEGRLRHLFREQIGLSLSRYRTWVRVERALVDGMAGASLTDAAHAWGFADSAHFTRACHSMTGVRPSDIVPTKAFFPIPEALRPNAGE